MCPPTRVGTGAQAELDGYLDEEGYIRCIMRDSESTFYNPDGWNALRYGFLTDPKFEGMSPGNIAVATKSEAVRHAALLMEEAGKSIGEIRSQYEEHLPWCDACAIARKRQGH